MKFNIIKNRNVFFIFSGILVVVSLISLGLWGLNLGLDFTGGTLLEIEYNNAAGNPAPSIQDIENKFKESTFKISSIQPTMDNGFIIRTSDMSEEQHQEFLRLLGDPEQITENRFESIGPVTGQELKEKAIVAIIISLIVIILYIAWAFRKVSKPVVSWKYGLGAVIALAHDIIIVTGAFSILGKFAGYEVDILFVTALLTILGYSVNDTIVVYDRTRENLIYHPEKTFEDTVNKSLNETISRSINVSLTTLLVLLSLYFLGGASIQEFVLALILGVVFGTYSSIFVASALLVVWYKMGSKSGK